MESYQRVLFCAGFAASCPSIAKHAKDLARRYDAQLSLVHVVETIHYDLPTASDLTIEEYLMIQAKTNMSKLAEMMEVPATNQWVCAGSPKNEIVRIAEENNIDLIVVGSHGKHGLAKLLGSTASGIMHNAKCDVLAVRVQDE